MSDGLNEFDLSAAWMRKSQGDLKAFMEAFAVRMQGAIPERVKIERRKDGLFSKLSHVVSISIETDHSVYQLVLHRAQLLANRLKIVRGVTLKSEQLAVPLWLEALNQDIGALAQYAESARSTLHEFLLS